MTGDGTGPRTTEPPLTVEHELLAGRHRVTVQGELDAFTVPDVRVAIAGRDGHDVELDLSGVTFIDSSGLAMIVEAKKHLAAQGHRLVIDARSPIVQRLLELSGVAGRLDDDHLA